MPASLQAKADLMKQYATEHFQHEVFLASVYFENIIILEVRRARNVPAALGRRRKFTFLELLQAGGDLPFPRDQVMDILQVLDDMRTESLPIHLPRDIRISSAEVLRYVLQNDNDSAQELVSRDVRTG